MQPLSQQAAEVAPALHPHGANRYPGIAEPRANLTYTPEAGKSTADSEPSASPSDPEMDFPPVAYEYNPQVRMGVMINPEDIKKEPSDDIVHPQNQRT